MIIQPRRAKHVDQLVHEVVERCIVERVFALQRTARDPSATLQRLYCRLENLFESHPVARISIAG